MRKGFGVCCIILGICCLIASVGFIAYNRWEEEHAQTASKDILQDVRESILDNSHGETPAEESNPGSPIDSHLDLPQEMLTTQVDGYDCIGVLSIPVLELELPVQLLELLQELLQEIRALRVPHRQPLQQERHKLRRLLLY